MRTRWWRRRLYPPARAVALEPRPYCSYHAGTSALVGHARRFLTSAQSAVPRRKPALRPWAPDFVGRQSVDGRGKWENKKQRIGLSFSSFPSRFQFTAFQGKKKHGFPFWCFLKEEEQAMVSKIWSFRTLTVTEINEQSKQSRSRAEHSVILFPRFLVQSFNLGEKMVKLLDFLNSRIIKLKIIFLVLKFNFYNILKLLLFW